MESDPTKQWWKLDRKHVIPYSLLFVLYPWWLPVVYSYIVSSTEHVVEKICDSFKANSSVAIASFMEYQAFEPLEYFVEMKEPLKGNN